MRHINLLPRKPFMEENFIFLLSTIIAFYLLIAGWMMYSYYDAQDRLTEVREQVQAKKLESEAAHHKLTPSELLQQFNVFTHDIQKLRAASRDWQPVLESVSFPLPRMARIVDMKMEPNGLLTANYQFALMEDASVYIAELEVNPLIESVTLDSFTLVPSEYEEERTTGETVVLPPGMDGPEPEPASRPVTYSPEPKSEVELYMESLTSKYPEPTSDSQAVLQKLEWELEKKRALELYHVVLPETPSELSNMKQDVLFSDPRYDVFSPEELERAMRELEQQRQQEQEPTTEESTVLLPPSDPSPSIDTLTTGPVTGSPSEDVPVQRIYEVTLKIQYATAALAGKESP